MALVDSKFPQINGKTISRDEINEDGEFLVWTHFVPTLQRQDSPETDIISQATSVGVMQAAHGDEDME
ncbi:hypothetical protein PSPO01_09462 [Paraphaeosphaeria sporulosa]